MPSSGVSEDIYSVLMYNKYILKKKKKEFWVLQYFLEREQNIHGSKYRDKVWSRD
jgi:hypothetical protein